MRKEFIQGSRKTAAKQCPLAAVILKADGGYMAFESADDAAVWKDQK